MSPIKHGTVLGYFHQKCRCIECRAAACDYNRRRRRNQGTPTRAEHDVERRQPCGTRAAYARGCRCDRCADANADYMRSYAFRRFLLWDRPWPLDLMQMVHQASWDVDGRSVVVPAYLTEWQDPTADLALQAAPS